VRKEYTISQEQLNTLLEASQPTRAVVLPGGFPMGRTTQQNANAAWQTLGAEMGFEWDTVQPVPDCCDKHFTAEKTTEGGAS
jgi:hypothetical protein